MSDPLRAARGIINGLFWGLLIWAFLALCLAVGARGDTGPSAVYPHVPRVREYDPTPNRLVYRTSDDGPTLVILGQGFASEEDVTQLRLVEYRGDGRTITYRVVQP